MVLSQQHRYTLLTLMCMYQIIQGKTALCSRDIAFPGILVNTVIPILMHFFLTFIFESILLPPTASASSNVKPNVSQSEDTFHNDVRFTTVYRKIYCRKSLTLPIRRWIRYIRKCITIQYKGNARKLTTVTTKQFIGRIKFRYLHFLIATSASKLQKQQKSKCYNKKLLTASSNDGSTVGTFELL